MTSTRIEDSDQLVIDASERTELSLACLPETRHVRVLLAGNAGPEFCLTFEATQIPALELVGCLAARIVLEGRVQIGHLTVRGPAPTMPIEIEAAEGLDIAVLSVECATLHLNQPAPGLSTILLTDAGLSIDRPLHVQHLVASGEVTFQTRGFHADTTSFPDNFASLRARFGHVDLGEISATRPELRLTGGVSKAFSVTQLPNGATVVLSDSTIHIVPGRGRTPGTGLDTIFRGTGDVRLKVPLLRPSFDPEPAGEIRVTVLEAGSISDGQGRINLVEARGGSVAGGRGPTPLVIVDVGDLHAVDLENVSLFDLPDLAAVQRLANARRVVPWMPRSHRVRRLQSRQFQAAGHLDSREHWLNVAKFWSDVDAVLHRSEVSGGTQSEVRLAVRRARRRSLSFRKNTREWTLMSVYAVFGYGERVAAPLAAWITTCLVAAAALHGLPITDQHEDFWRLLVRVAATPLSLVGVEVTSPDAPGLWDNAFYGLSRLAGVVLVGVAVMAGRRTVRPQLGR